MARLTYVLTPSARLLAERHGAEWRVWYQDDRGVRVPEIGGYSCQDPDAFADAWETRLRRIHERRNAPNESLVLFGAMCVGGIASVIFGPAALLILAWLLAHH